VIGREICAAVESWNQGSVMPAFMAADRPMKCEKKDMIKKNPLVAD
jgi:hypothetical protein